MKLDLNFKNFSRYEMAKNMSRFLLFLLKFKDYFIKMFFKLEMLYIINKR